MLSIALRKMVMDQSLVSGSGCLEKQWVEFCRETVGTVRSLIRPRCLQCVLALTFNVVIVSLIVSVWPLLDSRQLAGQTTKRKLLEPCGSNRHSALCPLTYYTQRFYIYRHAGIPLSRAVFGPLFWTLAATIMGSNTADACFSASGFFLSTGAMFRPLLRGPGEEPVGFLTNSTS